MNRRRGFFLADAILAFAILAAVAVLLTTGRSAAQRVTRAAEDERAAVRVAERYLAEHAVPGRTEAAPATAASDQVSMTPLDTPAVAGWQWVRVRATVNTRSAELVALVRRRS